MWERGVGKIKEAISFYECSSQVDPNNPIPVYGICNCYLGLKQYLEAIEAAKVVMELCKKSQKIEYARLGEEAEHLIECIHVVRKTIPFAVLRYPKKLEQPKTKLKNLSWKKKTRVCSKNFDSLNVEFVHILIPKRSPLSHILQSPFLYFDLF